MIDRAFIAVSILCAIATMFYATQAQFVEVAGCFYCSLMWFDMHLMRNHIRLLLIDWKLE